MEMKPVDHWAFPQIIEKWRKTLADSLLELTAKPSRIFAPGLSPAAICCHADLGLLAAD
jgi:hypothetical protein